MSIWLYFYYLASFNPRFRSLNDTIRKAGRERIASLLLHGAHEGAFRIPSEPAKLRKLCEQIQGLITGNTVMVATESGLHAKKMAEQTASEILKLLQVR